MVSQDKTAHRFCFQPDGQLVLYDQKNKTTWRMLAINGSDASLLPPGTKPMQVYLNTNGVLVANDTSNTTYWNTSGDATVAEEGPFYAVLQDDGVFVIRRQSDNTTIWSTAPAGKTYACAHVNSWDGVGTRSPKPELRLPLSYGQCSMAVLHYFLISMMYFVTSWERDLGTSAVV